MKRFLSFLSAAALLFTMAGAIEVQSSFSPGDLSSIPREKPQARAYGHGFADCIPSAWYYDYVKNAYEQGYVQGVSAITENAQGQYAPDSRLTRAQWALMLMRAYTGDTDITALFDRGDAMGRVGEIDGFPYTQYADLLSEQAQAGYADYVARVMIAEQNFPNVDQKWQCKYQNWDTPCTREDMAFLAIEIAEGFGEKFTVKSGIERNLADNLVVTNLPSATHIYKAYSAGILLGMDDGKFNPHGTLTRGQAAKVLYLLLNPSQRPKVTLAQ